MEVGRSSCDSPKEISGSESAQCDEEVTISVDAEIPLTFPEDFINESSRTSCTNEECGAFEEIELSSHPGIHHRSRIKKISYVAYHDDSGKKLSTNSSSPCASPRCQNNCNTLPVFKFTWSQLFPVVSVFIVALVVSLAGAEKNKDLSSTPNPSSPLNNTSKANVSDLSSFPLAFTSSAHKNGVFVGVKRSTSSTSSSSTISSTTTISTTIETSPSSRKDKSSYPPGSWPIKNSSQPQSSSYTFLNETHPFRDEAIDLFTIKTNKDEKTFTKHNNNKQLLQFQSDEPQPNQVVDNNRKSPTTIAAAKSATSYHPSSSIAQKARKPGSNNSSFNNVTAAFTLGPHGYISTTITKTIFLNASSVARTKPQTSIILNLNGASTSSSSTTSSQDNYKSGTSLVKENQAHYYEALTSSISAPENKPSSKSSPLERKQLFSSLSTATPISTEASPSWKDALARRAQLQIRRDLSRRVIDPDAPLNDEGDDNAANANSPQCDRIYLSTENGIRNGTFESPNLVGEDGRSLQCIYIFLARPEERVEIIFTQFNVRGTPPECVHEWVDLYTEVEDPDVELLILAPYGGRYCGKIPPRKRISLYGGIAIGFISDKNFTDDTLFKGTYAFFNDSNYVVGTPVPRTQCSYTVLGTSQRQGTLLSPTYPGVYPKKLSCSYKFTGIQGQRIRLEFRDFDLFYGGAHCPFDDVKIFDGNDTSSSLIGIYCGQQRNLVVYSSEHLMLVTFTTLERNTEAQNRGFQAVWEFSESFVKLDFIGKNSGKHIRGTECDQKILSQGQSSGAVYSPNYPFPYLPKIVCRYFVYGLQDPQSLERVKLSFEKFDVPSTANSKENEDDNPSPDKKCGDGFLKIYLKGQEMIQAYDKADYEFCGKEFIDGRLVPDDVVSDGPRLVLVFSSGEMQGSGFKAKYNFETEYRVPGTKAPDGSCFFTYNSSSRKRGEFNSPRFPSNYPSGMNCTYIFVQQPNEQVRIVFDNFKLRADKFNYTGGAYGTLCQEDWVEIHNVMENSEDRNVGRFCGQTAPGPIESREEASALKILLHTDDEGVYSGFKARYIYFNAKSRFGDCGSNITQHVTGVLTSPKWPANYDGPSKGEGSSTCNWYLSVKTGSRVMLNFQVFGIEGEPFTRGCPAAAVRIWEDPDGIPIELCGEALPLENSQYVSNKNLMRVTFITADKAVGARGFRAVWTEVQEAPCHSTYFHCKRTQFCIPDNLRCDGTRNCGSTSNDVDGSDEDECGLEGEINVILLVVLAAVSVVILVVIICVWAQRKKRRRRRRLQLRRPPIHVCDNAGARFAAMDSV